MQKTAKAFIVALRALAAWRPGLPTDRPRDDSSTPRTVPVGDIVVIQGHKSRPSRDREASPGQRHPIQRIAPLRTLGTAILAAAQAHGAGAQKAVHDLTTGHCNHNTLDFLHEPTLESLSTYTAASSTVHCGQRFRLSLISK